jgi:hypothetical protein
MCVEYQWFRKLAEWLAGGQLEGDIPIMVGLFLVHEIL